jgi:integrase
MSLYRHKRSPYWQYDFSIRGRNFSGSTRLADEDEAAKFESRKKDEARCIVDAEIRTNSSPMTIGRACERWWNEHGNDLNDPSTKTALDWLVTAIGPRTPLHEISNDLVSRVVQARKSDRRRAGSDGDGKQLYRPIKAITVNKTTISLLRRVMRRARENWNVTLPNEPTWSKHRLKETRRPVRELSAGEEATLDAIETPAYAVLRRFAIITGLRRRNVLLTWSQVDFEAGVIRIISKGGVPRTLPLSREAYAILWAQRGHHPEFVFTYICRKTRRIPKLRQLLRLKGQRYPITYSGFGSNKRNWIKAGVDARIHDLRHTTGMRTLRATGNLRVVQKILGHADIAITAKFYTDATLEDMRGAMETTAAAEPAAPLLLPAPKAGES